jgi:hypothetical protein
VPSSQWSRVYSTTFEALEELATNNTSSSSGPEEFQLHANHSLAQQQQKKLLFFPVAFIFVYTLLYV